MHPYDEFRWQMTRRNFFGDMGLRMGSIALAAMTAAGQRAVAASSSGSGQVHPPLPGMPHFAPKATSIIYLHMNGGPSQLDTWDYKPGLKDFFDKDLPESVRGMQRLSTMTSGQGRFPVAPSKFTFRPMGQCGTWVNTDLLPHTARIVDDITLIKTVHTNAINHDPACTFVMTGSEIPGKASIGSWLSYGLGSENNDLRQQWPSALQPHVGERVSPLAVQRRRSARQWRPGTVSAEPRRSHSHRSPHNARRAEPTEPTQLGTVWRS
jgi:hypothetical protein